ncbi:uncharacterized protein LOC131069480 isoform X1 [Cryptomeria japonica]|uniref:uncharacterized protein LOC131069480 isoform X1 n=1 Tax=Cryptomeria japonica TaxID=3369 RepID=UPI0027DA77C7|nr:uncharacterized protein LOC131069480 isoform X1 [Cryptomeria japonica]XP_057860916.2 uncharacterized protein LOC131069480 isoform X1 [Cryptomeria japonica]XP_057860925.2 uncharacterized protein LOC131069480 isoform X1 [Cryptomeria japonica]XP_057860931.2 uncharacterized protein LOC131069480 isoform X1 [Cryptomeria japonica]XP_057860937.2 uncharacterized protein LOC131069480 isoform X1 [Cryptomeria japonica]
METVIATTSGYRGREKAKLIELIIETGATYTGSLTKSNTHVVCWDFEGPRFALAKKLRLTIVNHRWFEECLQEGRHLTESPYIMCCGREVGPLLWEPPARAEVTRQKRRPLSDDEAFVTSDSSIPILYRESPLKMQEICFKSPKIAARSSYNNNEEDDRSISRRRDNQVHNKQPLQDLINKSYSQKAQIEDRNCSSSKQNMEKQRRKTRRLVKKSDYGSILNYVTPFEDDTGEPIGTCNVGEDKEKSDFKNSGIVPEPSHKFCPPEVGIEVVYCTSTGSRKNSIEGKTCESTVDMDIDIEDVGKPLSPTPSDHSISNEVACPICLTEASESRGILPCGHHFCLECIMKWSKILVSQKKKPPCPVCKEIFGFIFKNHADCHDQKIYSQTLPEFTNNNIYIVGENALEDNLQLPGNLHCNICGSGDTEELLLKCHRCGRRAAHTFCLDPPLPPVSDVPWTCAPCISGRRLVYEFP